MEMYMVVTADRYELPLDFDDNRERLAERLGVRPNSISKMVNRDRKPKKTKDKKAYRVIKVNVEEDADEASED